jgi:hypothetical protein
MKLSQRIAYVTLIVSNRIVDALFGYPKEYTVYPDGEHKRIRHIGGMWELKPAFTYQRRALSFVKHNYRHGWNIVKAPSEYRRFEGVDNLTEEPGRAISNMLDGDEFMRKIRESKFGA